jgi:hypothetical protein
MIEYIIISYLIGLGIILGTYNSIEEIPTKIWLCFVISPIIIPVFIGLRIAE